MKLLLKAIGIVIGMFFAASSIFILWALWFRFMCWFDKFVFGG